MTSLANCVWITGFHFLLFTTYAHRHWQEIGMSNHLWEGHPRRLMLLMGPAIGIISGLVLGLFAFIAGKMVKKN
jgi:hypothetical protein